MDLRFVVHRLHEPDAPATALLEFGLADGLHEPDASATVLEITNDELQVRFKVMHQAAAVD
ncbi:MAG: hypothetical protein ACRCZF_17795, partial [Gemmataceae bacterium]